MFVHPHQYYADPIYYCLLVRVLGRIDGEVNCDRVRGEGDDPTTRRIWLVLIEPKLREKKKQRLLATKRGHFYPNLMS